MFFQNCPRPNISTTNPCLNLSQKFEKEHRAEKQGEKEPENGAEKVRRVVDVIPAPAGFVRTVPEVQYAENKSRNPDRDKKHIDFIGRIEQDGGEKHGSDGARCADTGKTRSIAVFIKRCR